MTKRQLAGMAIALALVAPAPTRAAVPNRHELTFLALDAFPATSVDVSPLSSGQKLGRPGILWGLRYLYRLAPWLGVGVEAAYLDRGKKTDLRDQVILHTEVVTQTTNRLLLAVAQLRPFPHGKVAPFLIGGAGLHRSDVEVALHPIPGYAWGDGTNDRLLAGQGTGAALEVKGGVDWAFLPNATLGLEGGWVYLRGVALRSEGLGSFYGVADAKPALDMRVLGVTLSYRFDGLDGPVTR